MPENVDQFAIYSAKIFDLLYDSFPIPRSISRNEIISEYLTFSRHEELRELRIKNDIADLVGFTDDEELKRKVEERIPVIRDQLTELENEQRTDKFLQERIYEGTFEFLVFEGLFRECESGGYQLTSKGFSHLNRTFKDAAISENPSTNIAILKSIFGKTSDTTLQVAAGTAVNVITRVLGYG